MGKYTYDESNGCDMSGRETITFPACPDQKRGRTAYWPIYEGSGTCYVLQVLLHQLAFDQQVEQLFGGR